MYLLNRLFMKGLFNYSSNHLSNHSSNYSSNYSSNHSSNGLFRCWFIYKIYIIKNI